jgi:hypothetical protein
MGFEVIYSYHERDDDGNYNRDEEKQLRRTIGEAYEDIPLSKLASSIMAQMARRDIWVTGVEVFEFAKKSVNFRETNGGIILKNKKYLLDSANVEAREVDISQPQPPGLQPHQMIQHQQQPQQQQPEYSGEQPHNQGLQSRRPIKYMTFAPELHLLSEVKTKGMRFTEDKKYPVYQILPHPTGVGEVYKMIDDGGREQLVSDKYFVPGEVNLFGDKQLGFSETPEQRDGGQLYWGGASSNDDVPVIRR